MHQGAIWTNLCLRNSWCYDVYLYYLSAKWFTWHSRFARGGVFGLQYALSIEWLETVCDQLNIGHADVLKKNRKVDSKEQLQRNFHVVSVISILYILCMLQVFNKNISQVNCVCLTARQTNYILNLLQGLSIRLCNLHVAFTRGSLCSKL